MKSSSGGIVIRLIDVAMIILFGFIAISDIKVRAQIKLPSEENEEQQNTDEKDPLLYFVKIDPAGFIVELDEQVIASTNDVKELETLLALKMQQSQASGEEMVVLIEPDENSMIQQTVDLLDICERNNIPKNINYESMQF